MIPLDKCLAVFAVAQTIIASLRASSRIVFMKKGGKVGATMEGPLIEPPKKSTSGEPGSDAFLWELSNAFRHGVILALERDNFDSIEYEVNDMVFPRKRSSSLQQQQQQTVQYSLSPSRGYGTTQTGGAGGGDDEIDEEIELLLQKVDMFGEKHGKVRSVPLSRRNRRSNASNPFTAGRMVSGGMVHTMSADERNTKLKKTKKRDVQSTMSWSSGTVSSQQQQQQRRVLPFGKQQHPTVEDGRIITSTAFTPSKYSDLESDFHLTLSTVKLIGTVATNRKEGTTTSTKATTSGSSSSKSNGSYAPRVAQLTAYAPEGFAQLRSLFGISEEAFRKSILESGPYVSFSSNSKGAARAGGVFFFTRDGAYLIKTIKQDEVPALLSMLPSYYKFMQRNARSSLLTRYCGLYEVTFRDDGDEKPYTFVVMNSVFPAGSSLSERYDLKGSTVGRECSIEEREAKGRRAVLQDLDLAREVELIKSLQRRGRYSSSQGYGINIGQNAKAALMTQLRRDVDFLVSCNVMDYSLLVGVERVEESPSGLDAVDMHMMSQRKRNDGLEQIFGKDSPTGKVASGMVKHARNILTPPLAFASRMLSLAPPTYVDEDTTVDGGPLAKLPGYRMGSPAVYYIGLIDFLQPFNAKKKLEYRAKSAVYDSNSFSCIPPEEYGERFLAFMDDHIV